MELHLVLAGSNVQDLRKSEAFLTSKGLQRITVLSQQSEVLSLLKQQSAEERRMTVVIGQVSQQKLMEDWQLSGKRVSAAVIAAGLLGCSKACGLLADAVVTPQARSPGRLEAAQSRSIIFLPTPAGERCCPARRRGRARAPQTKSYNAHCRCDACRSLESHFTDQNLQHLVHLLN